MSTKLFKESRSALSRARFFLDKAIACPIDARVDFEAFIEAAIIFGRAAVHRMEYEYREHPKSKGWWDSLSGDPAIEFFRTERDWILKQAPPKIGQKIFVSSVGSSEPSYTPKFATELYYIDDPNVLATKRIEEHLNNLENRLDESERLFFGNDTTT